MSKNQVIWKLIGLYTALATWCVFAAPILKSVTLSMTNDTGFAEVVQILTAVLGLRMLFKCIGGYAMLGKPPQEQAAYLELLHKQLL